MSVEQAARSLWVPIPEPRRAAPKPTLSWRKLKRGQYLLTKRPLQLGPGLPAQELCLVLSTTNQGVTMRSMGSGGEFQWSLEGWEEWFTRCRRPAGAPKLTEAE